MFFVNSFLLGLALSMDAFSVSITNSLHEPNMKKIRMFSIATVYAVFQFIMPFIGWFCVHTIANSFEEFQKFIPWIGLILLIFIGGKMIFEAFSKKEDDSENPQKKLTILVLLIQGIATSIDALSVGFTISDYKILAAIICCLIIGFTTLIICLTGLFIGKKVGYKLNNKADIFGGIILILIGIEIFIKGIFF